MTAIPFVKASACGNDFLIIDGMHAPPDLAAFTYQICERHNGVGADGVEWLFPAQDADIRARLLNADGSEAEISGNGTRCVAEMGEPQVGNEFSIKVAFGEVRGIPVSMGNPHFVVFVDEFSPGWQGDGAEIGKHHDFKYGINVEFVKVCDRENIEVRFYERGVGETQSSGTGSCASAVASIFSKRAESPVRVHAPGGAQTVRWEGEVFLRGPAQIICRGEYLI
jgi:diaminopimelate epimerase